jgi:hypothetical protein
MKVTCPVAMQPLYIEFLEKTGAGPKNAIDIMLRMVHSLGRLFSHCVQTSKTLLLNSSPEEKMPCTGRITL